MRCPRSTKLEVIHRDIKPENVLLGPNGIPRLSDFGLARVGPRGITAPRALRGTVPYMSPEGLRGAPLDQRTDVWSLGVTLFEMLAGCRPFQAEISSCLVRCILTQPAPDLASVCGHAPPGLADLVRRMLEKDRKRRLVSAAGINSEVGALLAGLSR